METSNISRAARHCTGTLHDHVVGGCIQMRLESASINQSRLAPLKHHSQAPDYRGSRALSRLVAPCRSGGGKARPASVWNSKTAKYLAELLVFSIAMTADAHTVAVLFTVDGAQCQDAPIANLHY